MFIELVKPINMVWFEREADGQINSFLDRNESVALLD